MLLVNWLSSLRYTLLSSPVQHTRQPHAETGQAVQVELLEQRRMLAAPVARVVDGNGVTIGHYSGAEVGEHIAGEDLLLSAEESYDPDGTITDWDWDFGGNDPHDFAEESGESISVSWSKWYNDYSLAGGAGVPYLAEVRLRLTDDDGNTTTVALPIDVLADVPTVETTGGGDSQSECDCSCSCPDKTPTAQPDIDPNAGLSTIDGPNGLGNDSEHNPHPILTFEFRLPYDEVPVSYAAKLEFGSEPDQLYTLDVNQSWEIGENVRVALQVDATSLETGRYEYTATFTPHLDDGNGGTTPGTPFELSDEYVVINRIDSVYGNRWWHEDQAQLILDSAGASYVGGRGLRLVFDDDGSGGYSTPAGTFRTLAKTGTGASTVYTLASHHDGSKQVFDADGFLTKVIDRNNLTTTLDYVDADGDGQTFEIDLITDPYGEQTSYSYGLDGFLETIVDKDGDTFTYTIDVDGLLQTIVGPAASVGGDLTTIEFDYNADKLLTDLTEAGSGSWSFEFDADDLRLRGVTDPAGVSTGYTPATVVPLETIVAVGDVKATVETAEGDWTRTYDRWGYVLSETDPLGNTTTYTRNADGLVTQIVDANNVTSTFVYDAYGRRTSATYAVGTSVELSESWTYDATKTLFGKPLTHTDTSGEVYTYTYDAGGNLLTAVTPDPDGAGPLSAATTSYTYDTNGWLTSLTEPDPDGTGTLSAAVTSYTYDSSGNLTTLVDANDATWTYEYNSRDELAKEIAPDPDGTGTLTTAVTLYEYDLLGRLTKTVEPNPASGATTGGATTLYEYDLDGLLTSVVDPVSGTTTYEYDGAGRLTRMVDAEGGITTSFYDPATGRLIRTGGPTGEWTLYEYDAAGRLTRTSQPASDHLAHFFDQDENHTDTIGVLLEDAYFQGGEVWHITTGDPEVINGRLRFTGGAGSDAAYVEGGSSDGVFSANVRFHSGSTYGDHASYPGTADEVAIVVLRHQDGSNWLRLYLDHTDGTASLVERYVDTSTDTTYTNTIDSTSGLTFDDDVDYAVEATLNGDAVSVVVALAGLTVTLDGTANHTTGTKYGLLRQGQGTSATGTFAVSIDDLLFAPDGGGIAVTTTEYDDLGQVSYVVGPDPDGFGTLHATPTTSYAYDDLGRMTSMTDALGAVTSYEYDDLGNVTQVITPDPDGTGTLSASTMTYAYDNLGRQTGMTDGVGNVTTTVYDEAGRVVREESPDPRGTVAGTVATTYAYDAAGNLTQVTAPDPDGGGALAAPVTTYEYDLFGRQTESTDPLGNVTSTYFDHVGRVTRVVMPDPDGTGTLHSAPTINYAYDVAGRMTSMTDAEGDATTYAYDLLGRVVSTTDAAGYVTHTDYDPSGRVLRVIGEEGSWTETAYDVAGNVTSTRRGQNGHHAAFFETDDTTLSTADTLHTGQNWFAVTGDPEVEGGQLVLSKTGSGTSTVLLNGGTSDGTLSVDFTFDEESDYDAGNRVAVIYFRHDSGSDWHRVYLYENLDQVSVVERKNGSTLPALATTNFTLDQGRTYRVDVALDGNNIAVSIDGRSILSTSTGTSIGTIYGVQLQNSGSSTLGSTTLRYDNLIFNPDGDAIATTNYEYDAVGRLSQMVDAEGNTAGYQYDLLGRQTASTRTLVNGTVTTVNTVSREYDALGRLSTEGDGDRSQEWTYDQNNRVTQSVDAFGRTTTTSYDDSGAVTQTVRKNGTLSQTTSYEYDSLGRVTKTTLPDPSTTSGNEVSLLYEYDLAGNLTEMTNGAGETTTYAYDDLHRRTQTVMASGTTDAATTSTEYDLVGRTVKMTNADDETTTYAYDDRGLLTTLTDSGGNATTHTYDGLGRRTSTTQENGTTDPTTQYAYDFAGNMTSLTDPNGNVTEWDYDLLGRRIKETIELTETTTGTATIVPYLREYEYDEVGHLVRKTDRLGRVTEYEYDFSYDGRSNYRLAHEDWIESGATIGGYDWTYITTGSNKGYLDTAIGEGTTLDYGYDSLGRVTSIVQQHGAADVSVTQSWDNLNRRTSVETSIHNGTNYIADATTDYTYDKASRVTSILQTDSDTGAGGDVTDKLIEFAYDQIGRTTQIDRYESTTNASDFVAQSRFTYDDLGRLTALTHDGGNTGVTTDDIAAYTWTWNAAGRLAEYGHNLDGTATYSYDATGQLTEVDHTNNAYDVTYNWDAGGNRDETGDTTDEYNRTTETSDHEYDYDAEGNRTRKEDKSSGDYETYEWDHRNRLVKVNFFDSSDVLQQAVKYTYDALNRVVGREHDTNGNSTFNEEEWYAHDAAGKRDGVTSVPLDDIILVLDDTGSLTTRYLHGPGIDSVLAEERYVPTTELYWALADHQSTVRDVVTYNGTTTTSEIHRIFDAFGKLESETGPGVSDGFRYGFHGRPTDETTEQVQMRMRFFDVILRAWINDDPIAFAAGDANLSRFVGNAATWLGDPSGLSARIPKTDGDTIDYGSDSKVRWRTHNYSIHIGKLLPDGTVHLSESYGDRKVDKKNLDRFASTFYDRYSKKWKCASFEERKNHLQMVLPGVGSASTPLGTGDGSRGEGAIVVGTTMALPQSNMVSPGPGALFGVIIVYGIAASEYIFRNDSGNPTDEGDQRAEQDARAGMRAEDSDLDAHDLEFYGGDGVIYFVPGSATSSGKGYVGSTGNMPNREKCSSDGRDRSQAIQIGSFPIGNDQARREAEQRAIDDNGGLGNLDNRRNEIAR